MKSVVVGVVVGVVVEIPMRKQQRRRLGWLPVGTGLGAPPIR